MWLLNSESPGVLGFNSIRKINMKSENITVLTAYELFKGMKRKTLRDLEQIYVQWTIF